MLTYPFAGQRQQNIFHKFAPGGGMREVILARYTMRLEAPDKFTTAEQTPGLFARTYHIELLTPMAGGGIKSWVPDIDNPVRTQSIKGNLRFWWRTMQHISDAEELKERESRLWGSTGNASSVRIAVSYAASQKPETIIPGECPPYVLFPLQSLQGGNFTLIKSCSFQMEVICPEEVSEQVTQSIKLWILFGGIGARTRRGCGSLYCPEIMEAFPSPEAIADFLKPFRQHTDKNAAGSSPYPTLSGSRFAWSSGPKKNDPIDLWNSFLKQYSEFRQGRNIARNRGTGNRPGRTRWPEADAIRRLSDCTTGVHPPEHPAGNWFPRGAYGLPIQIEFRGERTDPPDKYFLQPGNDHGDRWPSPSILKIIKLKEGAFIKSCLILNAAVPDDLVIVEKTKSTTTTLHRLGSDEKPMSYAGKVMPPNAPLKTGTDPYDALINHLKLSEVK